MGLKKRKTGADEDESSVYKLFEGVLLSLAQEVKSLAGKVNLFFDTLMGLIVIVYLFSSGIYEVAKVVASIWNKDLTKYINGTTTFVLILLFFIFCVLCLILMYIKERAEQRTKEIRK